jgi:hypothetical protein
MDMYNKYVPLMPICKSLSQLYRFSVYFLEKPKMQLKNGMFIISVDVDVGSKELAIINGGNNDANVSSRFSEYSVGEIEEWALPLFVDLFNRFEIPVTFALRGQLTEVCDSILELLLKSSVKHDIGAHGYYHKNFKNLSNDEAENELKLISDGMKGFGIIPRSFVFPRNNVAHLDLLERYGYKCYRGADLGLGIEKKGQLCNIRPSYPIDLSTSFKFLKMTLNLCIARKQSLHVWFHLWNWSCHSGCVRTKESMQRSIYRFFSPLFEYVKQKEKSGVLSLETMLSAAEKVEELI